MRSGPLIVKTVFVLGRVWLQLPFYCGAHFDTQSFRLKLLVFNCNLYDIFFLRIRMGTSTFDFILINNLIALNSFWLYRYYTKNSLFVFFWWTLIRKPCLEYKCWISVVLCLSFYWRSGGKGWGWSTSVFIIGRWRRGGIENSVSFSLFDWRFFKLLNSPNFSIWLTWLRLIFRERGGGWSCFSFRGAFGERGEWLDKGSWVLCFSANCLIFQFKLLLGH